MGERAGDVLRVKPLVEVDRDVDALHDLRRAAGKATAPRRIGRGSTRLPCWGRVARLLAHGRLRPAPRGWRMKKLVGALIVLVVLCLAGLAAALYWPGAPLRRDDGNIMSSKPDSAAPQPRTLGQFTPLARPRPAPELAFAAPDGRKLRLADFR